MAAAQPCTSAYPNGIIPVVANSTQGANNTISAQLTAASDSTMFLASVTITAGGATAASMTTLQITGLCGAQTMKLAYGVPAGAGVPAAPLQLTFDPPLPSDAPGTNIKVELGPCGSGNLYAYVAVTGFKA